MRKFLFFLFVFQATELVAQNWVRNDIFREKVFIENKGQFNGLGKYTETDIQFGVKDMQQQLYFTPKGLIYRYDITETADEEEYEEEEREFKSHEEEVEYEKKLIENSVVKTYLIEMEWLNANSNPTLIAEDFVPEYYIYGDAKKFHKASAYKKLTYKNLYPNIDVEYIFHEREGIKYSLILHPGADASKIKMKYKGMDGIYKDNSGNIHLSIALGDVVDHAPVTFYEASRSSIGSSYMISDSIVSFHLDSYNTSETIVIDPWTVGIILNTTNKALEVEHDNVGDIYILGGGGNSLVNPLILKKYTSLGALLWTYTSVGRGEYGQDLKTDPYGNVFIDVGAIGIAGNVNRLVKLDAAGNIIWSGTNMPKVEPYRIVFNCNYDQFFIPGTSAGDSRGGIFSGTTGNFLGYNNTMTGCLEDIRDFIRGPNGNYYGVSTGQAVSGFCSGQYNVMAFSPSLVPMYSVPHSYNIIYWSAGYSGHFANQPASFHMIGASKQYLYTTNGIRLDRRNITTGVIINGVNIPGGINAASANGNSGVLVDTCGNVYVGSQSAVYKYDALLNLITSAATAGAVYDVCLGSNGEILACGNGFLASLNLSACMPPALFSATVSSTPTGNCSNGNTGTASVNAIGGSPVYNYSWAPGGQTTPVITGLSAGTYTVVVTDRECGIINQTVVVTGIPGAISLTPLSSNLTCNNNNSGTASVIPSGGTGSYSYSWSTGDSGALITGLSAGIYSCTVNDANGCTAVQAISVSQPPAITGVGSSTPALCSSNSYTGTAGISASGGSGIYNFFWEAPISAGVASFQVQFGVTAGTYTVTISDAANPGCSITTTVSVGYTAVSPSATFTLSTNDTVCLGSSVNFTNTGSANTTRWRIIGPGFSFITDFFTNNLAYTFTALGSTMVSHVVTVGGCSGVALSYIEVIPCITPTVTACSNSPVASINSTSVTCNGRSDGTAVASVNPGTGAAPFAYQWSSVSSTQSAISNLIAGTYTVVVTDLNFCKDTQSVIINQPSALALSTSTSPAGCGLSDGTASVSATGGTSPYSYQWSVSGSQASVSNLSGGVYTVTVTDSNGCTSSANATVNNFPAATIAISSTSVSCNGGNNAIVTATISGGANPYIYSWLPVGTTGNSAGSVTISNQQAGNYQFLVSDNSGCLSSATVSINQPAKPGSTINPLACNSYTHNGQTYSSSGLYTQTLSTIPGCDSILTINLTINNSINTAQNQTICQGQSIFIHGVSQNTSGVYTQTFVSAGACDSTSIVTLQVNPIINTNHFAYICSGDSLLISSTWQKSSGAYADTLVSIYGCDSIMNIALTVSSPINTSNNINICNGQAVWIHGVAQNTNGIYTQTFIATGGCDSISSVTLAVAPIVINSMATSICSGDSLFVNGFWRKTSGTYSDTLLYSTGCDSIINTTTLTIDPLPSIVITGNTPLCPGDSTTINLAGGITYQWSNGATTSSLNLKPTTINTYTITVTGSGNCAKDTSITVLVNNISSNTISPQACSSYTHNGQTYTLSGVYTQTLANVNNCDSILTINLTINNTLSTVGSQSICDGQTTTIHGQPQSIAGVYTQTFISVAGCDSISGITLTVYGNPIITIGKDTTISSGSGITLTATGSSASGGYSWSTGATTQSIHVQPTTTTQYIITITDTNDCLAMDTITVNVNEPCEVKVEILVPNSFSPNGDNQNDLLKLYASINISDIHFTIYNRWGERVFETDNTTTAWDGKYRGKPVDTGVYVYVLKVPCETDNTETIKKGNISLMR